MKITRSGDQENDFLQRIQTLWTTAAMHFREIRRITRTRWSKSEKSFHFYFFLITTQTTLQFSHWKDSHSKYSFSSVSSFPPFSPVNILFNVLSVLIIRPNILNCLFSRCSKGVYEGMSCQSCYHLVYYLPTISQVLFSKQNKAKKIEKTKRMNQEK